MQKVSLSFKSPYSIPLNSVIHALSVHSVCFPFLVLLSSANSLSLLYFHYTPSLIRSTINAYIRLLVYCSNKNILTETKQEALNDKKLRYYIARSIWLMMKLGIFIVSPHIGLPLTMAIYSNYTLTSSPKNYPRISPHS